MTSSPADPARAALPDRPRGGAATWYDVLDVGPAAHPDELRIAYERSLALVEGRTLGGYFLLDPLAIDGARADIEAAWAVLSDVERRAAYDRAIGLPASSLLPTPAPWAPSTTTTPPTATPPASIPARLPRSPSLKFLAPVLDDSTPPTSTTTPPTTITATTTATTMTTTTTARPSTLPTATTPSAFNAGLFALDGEVNGQVLKKLREARGLSLDELAELTKIRRPYLQAIEDQDLENLPARVYLRGFLTQIARALRVDKLRLAEGYVAFVARFGR